jgi:hypothetical protein
MQVRLREQRQLDDFIAFYYELQTLLDREWRIDYACKCDSKANDLRTTIQELRSTEEHRTASKLGRNSLTSRLKHLSAQATDLGSPLIHP